MFGLSQLYQIRGRVGRIESSGLCLSDLSAQSTLDGWYAKAARDFSVLDSLGAGFQPASHDLDIRGQEFIGDAVGTLSVRSKGWALSTNVGNAVRACRGWRGQEDAGDWSPTNLWYVGSDSWGLCFRFEYTNEPLLPFGWFGTDEDTLMICVEMIDRFVFLTRIPKLCGSRCIATGRCDVTWCSSGGRNHSFL